MHKAMKSALDSKSAKAAKSGEVGKVVGAEESEPLKEVETSAEV